MNLREQILSMADPSYRDFSSALIPGCLRMQGVRLPVLRKMAVELCRNSQWRGFLKGFFSCPKEELWFEEIMLAGFCIGGAKAPLEETLALVRDFLPYIDNWSVNDSFCVSLKAAGKNRDIFWAFISPFFQAEKEFSVRFAAVMALDHYLVPEWIDQVLEALASMRHPGFYAKAGAAWAFSVCYVKFPEKTAPFLAPGQLDAETLALAIRKIRESHRVSPEDKARLQRGLRV